MNARTDRQEALWQAWRAHPSERTVAPLLDSFEPMVKSYVRSLGNHTLPSSAVAAHARQQALKAFETYQPSKARLSTHVGSQLRKTNRYVYANQAIGRLPEEQILQTKAFRQAHDTLDERLGRTPSTAELADHLRWSQGQVSRYQRGLRGSMRLSTNPILEELSPDVQQGFAAPTILKYVYHDLQPDEQVVFEHTYGYGGKPVLETNQQIARAAGLSESKVRSIKSDIYDQVREFERAA